MINILKHLCIIGDVHFGYGNDKFLDSQIRFFVEQLVPYLMKRKIQKIIFTGDFFDDRKHLSIYMKNKIFDLIETTLKEFDIIVYLGNHDVYYKNNNSVNSLRFLKSFKNVTVIEEITQLKIMGKNFLFVPWLYDLDVFKRYIDENDVSEVDVCFGHFDIIGSKMGKNTFSKSGLTKELLSRFPKVFSGHYHTRSIDKNGNSEIVYVGTPYQMNRGDKDEARGFHILNVEDMSYEFVENYISTKFISFVYPEKISKENVQGNIIDVFVNDDGNIDHDEVQDYIDSISKMGPIQDPIKRIISSINNVDIKDIKVKNLKELFDEYIEQLNLNVDIKDKVIEELNVLYEDCQKEF